MILYRLCHPRIHMLKTNPSYDDIRRCSSWKTIMYQFSWIELMSIHERISRSLRELSSLFHLPPHKNMNVEEMASYEFGSRPLSDTGYFDTFILSFLGPSTVRNTFVLFVSYQICSILLLRPVWSKTNPNVHLGFIMQQNN